MELETNGKKYKVIYADPPWKYNNKPNKKGRSVECHYNTMDLVDICRIPVDKIADKNSVLLLWTTYPKIKDALYLIDHWGFKYKTVAFTWVKENKNSDSVFWGLGNYTRSNAEICLLATKGSGVKRENADVHQVIISPIMEHSKKPIEIKYRIDRLFGDVERIELFAREQYGSWSHYGDELSETIQKRLS